MQAATGEQPSGIFFHVVGDELVHARSESDHLRRDIIDEHSAIDARIVQMFQKGFRRPAEFSDLLKVRSVLLHELQRVGLEHFDRLDVDVAVGDQGGGWSIAVQVANPFAAANSALFVNTRIISRRYSGVKADVVNGFAVRAARSPMASASFSSTAFPANSSEAPFTITGAGLTAVSATWPWETCPFDRLNTTATPARG